MNPVSIRASSDFLPLFLAGMAVNFEIAAIAIALGLYKPGLPRKLIYFAAVGVMLVAVIVTFSRGGFIGLVAAGLLLVRRLGKKNRVATTGALVFAVISWPWACPV